MLEILEQKEVVIGGEKYLITAMGASEGLEYIPKIGKETPSMVKEAIIKYVSHQGVKFDVSRFDKHFSKKYSEIYDLYNEIINFNFEGVISSPNEESGM